MKLKFILSTIVVALLALIIDWKEFFRIVSGARWEILVVVTILFFFENMVVAWRWKMLLKPLGIDAKFMDAFRSYVKGLFVAYFVPAAITSDVVKMVDFNRSRSQGVEVLASIFMERLFGAMSVSVAVLTGLAISPLVEGQAGLRETLFLSALGVMGICSLSLYADKFFHLMPASILAKIPKLAHWMGRAEGSFQAYRRQPRTLVGAMLMSLVIQLMRVGPIYLIALAIGLKTEFYPFLIAVPVILLINMVPVIGSRIGTEQGMFVLLLAPAGVTAESALAIAIVTLVLGVITTLPGGYWFLKQQHKGAVSSA